MKAWTDYPFEGTIKIETVKDEDGNDKAVRDEVKCESSPIVVPYINRAFHGERMQLDQSLNMRIGQPKEPNFIFSNTTEWARVDKDNNLVHLDMDLCTKGPANVYTALAVGIWNAAIEKAASEFECDGGFYYDEIRESILRLKK